MPKLHSFGRSVTFDHALYWVQIPNSHCDLLQGVDLKPEKFIFFVTKSFCNDQWDWLIQSLPWQALDLSPDFQLFLASARFYMQLYMLVLYRSSRHIFDGAAL